MVKSESSSDLSVVLWIAALCWLMTLTLIVGGATRLTNSGLSITEWKPIVGAIPPLSHEQWLDAFDKYKRIPEYRIENPRMDLEGFKAIYFWEYAHRNLGRLLGLFFFVPFLVFLIRRRLPPPLIRRLLIGFALGGLQGGLGWYMVKSGLADRTDVSPYRLAAHLGLALAIYTYFLSILLSLIRRTPLSPEAASLRRTFNAVRVLVAVQILFGVLTAGLRAGYSYNTFPLMNGEWFPSFHTLSPWWIDIFEDSATVQFIHRWLGLVAFAGTIFLWRKAEGLSSIALRRTVRWIPALATIQVLSGVATLLLVMPLGLALAHQFGALALWTAITVASHSISGKKSTL